MLSAIRHFVGWIFAAVGGILAYAGLVFIKIAAWCTDHDQLVDVVVNPDLERARKLAEYLESVHKSHDLETEAAIFLRALSTEVEEYRSW